MAADLARGLWRFPSRSSCYLVPAGALGRVPGDRSRAPRRHYLRTLRDVVAAQNASDVDHFWFRSRRRAVRADAGDRRHVWRGLRLRATADRPNGGAAAGTLRTAGHGGDVRVDREGLLERPADDRRHERVLSPTAFAGCDRGRHFVLPQLGTTRPFDLRPDARPGGANRER